MEFHDLGKHCSAEGCNQQDFLPFTCNGCGNVHCLQHRTHAAHDCANANFDDKRVLECSLCGKILKSQSGMPRDVTVKLHVASGCVAEVRKARSNKQKCSVPGCRGSEFVKVSCKSCSKNFCFRHRHEDDHKCEGAATAVAMTRTTVAQRQTAGAAAGGSISNPFRRAAAAASSTPAAGNAGANGRGCGTEAKAAADRRAAAAEGRRRSAGRGAGITSH
ncbi:unnamed protein product [Sphacelaria rigidula]